VFEAPRAAPPQPAAVTVAAVSAAVEACATHCVFLSLAALAPSYALSARLRVIRLLALLLCTSPVPFGYALGGLWNYLSSAYGVELGEKGQLHSLAANGTASDEGGDFISLVRMVLQSDNWMDAASPRSNWRRTSSRARRYVWMHRSLGSSSLCMAVRCPGSV
jgi:hypothetical protein